MKIFLAAIMLISSISLAQELNCTVSVNVDNVPISFRDRLQDFKGVLENYLNKTRFGGDGWEGPKISCAFDIFFTAANDANYSAQVAISSQRDIYNTSDKSLMLKVNDNAWSFVYQKGQSLYSNQSTFDPLTSFLDFYANMIIGLDMDSYEELGGSAYFSKALSIANFGASSQFNNGWTLSSGAYSRRRFVDEITNDTYRPFREAEFDYYYGIDVFKLNQELGEKYIVKLVNSLKDMRNKIDLTSVLMKTFFNAKSDEIISRLKDYPDRYEVFRTLKQLDPNHGAKYDEAINQ